MPSFFIVKCKWHPVVDLFVNLPDESMYFGLPVERYFGPTIPIIWSDSIKSLSLTI